MKFATPCARFLFVLTVIFGGRAPAAFLVDPTGGTTIWSDKAGANDEVASSRVLGFPFSFFGNDPVLTIDISANGNLNFSKSTAYANDMLANTVARISPLWDDLEVLKGSGDFVSEKRALGKYYAVTWQVHESDRAGTRHAFQAVLFGTAMRVSGYDFQQNDIVFSYQEIGPTFSKGNATVSLDPGDDGEVVAVPDAAAANGLLPYGEAGLLPVGGYLLFRPDDSGSYTVTVVGNRAPRPRDDVWYVKKNVPCKIDALANDSDPDKDALEIVSATPGLFGTVAVGADGMLLYTPTKEFSGLDQFTYTVRDPSGLTATAKVTLRAFALGRGTFEGFLLDAPSDEEPAPELTSSGTGYFKLTLGAKGEFTGQIIYGGYAKTLKGVFDEWGNYTLEFERLVDGDVQKLKLVLHLDLLNETQPFRSLL